MSSYCMPVVEALCLYRQTKVSLKKSSVTSCFLYTKAAQSERRLSLTLSYLNGSHPAQNRVLLFGMKELLLLVTLFVPSKENPVGISHRPFPFLDHITFV